MNSLHPDSFYRDYVEEEKMKLNFKKMKKYSDYFSGLKRFTNHVGSRIATTALFMVAAITMGFAQTPDFTFIEGSVHSFKVDNHPGNTFAWDVRDVSFGAIDTAAFTFDAGTQSQPNVTVRFNDMNRFAAELVHLAVTETNPNGCSTTRALRIMLEPNNMFLEFASTPTQDCYSPGDYNAPLKVGLNFTNKAAGVPIPSNHFPLLVSYTVRNLTEGTVAVAGNGGVPLTIEYSSVNDYNLLVTEAVGLPNQTTEYELTITSVIDKYETKITENTGDIRIQFRVINHLPQSGTMDMAMAYVITGIEYLGTN